MPHPTCMRLFEPANDEPRDASFDESLIQNAAQAGPVACVWEAKQGLVVPRSYQSLDGFASACQSYHDLGWPVTVRQSGGGIVPQGPGIINLSLAYSVAGKPLDHSDDAYRLICRLISQALDTFNIASHTQAVDGSFCDGRYNLAIAEGGQARKIAGTAQVWRRCKTSESDSFRQVVLVHALILACVDTESLTDIANEFESAVGSIKRYSSQRIASLYHLHAMQPEALPADSFLNELKHALKRQIS